MRTRRQMWGWILRVRSNWRGLRAIRSAASSRSAGVNPFPSEALTLTHWRSAANLGAIHRTSMTNKTIALVATCVAAVLLMSCKTRVAPRGAALKVVAPPNDTNASIVVRPASGARGTIERLDPALDQLLPKGAVIEKLAEGFDWSEGPVWMPAGYLLFSDVPLNTIFKWQEGQGVSIFMQPSGYTGTAARGGEPGSNGLTHDKQGRLIACQHGDRRVARLEQGKFTAVADRFEGKRF